MTRKTLTHFSALVAILGGLALSPKASDAQETCGNTILYWTGGGGACPSGAWTCENYFPTCGPALSQYCVSYEYPAEDPYAAGIHCNWIA